MTSTDTQTQVARMEVQWFTRYSTDATLQKKQQQQTLIQVLS